MRQLTIAALVLLAASVHAETDLSGTWRLDRDLTTANVTWVRTTVLVIRQRGEEVRFEHLDGARRIGAEVFITDGEERPRFSSRIERAFARARWQKNELVIETRSFLDIYGYQSYNDTERWQLRSDGKTLVRQDRDGKVLVFYREVPSVPVP
jgi:hypothetical protein